MDYSHSKAEREKSARQLILEEIVESEAEEKSARQSILIGTSEEQWLQNTLLQYQSFLSSEDMTEQDMLAVLKDILSVCQYGHSSLEKLTPGLFQTPLCSDVIREALKEIFPKMPFNKLFLSWNNFIQPVSIWCGCCFLY